MTRRTILKAGALATLAVLAPPSLFGRTRDPIRRAIPSSGELLPVIGMGTWQTFDIGNDPVARNQLADVLKTFLDLGGSVIDSSPMYGRSESVVGDLLAQLDAREAVFAATKVWTDGRQSGIDQMQASLRRMGLEVLDLMQIHNLRDWRTHLPVLEEWKRQGRFRYIGITTSHGRFHDDLEKILRNQSLDFVQLTYNLKDRGVENRLLPLAFDRGVATLINRPFQQGELFRKVKGLPLPWWCDTFDCQSWAQFFLKYIVSNPAVTCVIPATSKVHHMKDNMEAAYGRLPDEAMRKKMLEYYVSL